MRLSHNLASLNVYKEYSKVLNKQSTSLGRISCGYKVSGAKDDPNTLAQSEKMRMQIRGLQMADNNIQDGISMLQTAEGGMDNITSMLQRVRELVVQSGDGSETKEDKASIQNEVDQMLKGIDDIAESTEFNGVKLLNDTSINDNSKPNVMKMCVGANTDENISIPKYNFKFSDVNVNCLDGTVMNFSSIDLSKPGGTEKALTIVDGAINEVLKARSQYGAIENRFESQIISVNEIGDRIQGAESSIRDVDISKEILEYSKNSLLSEAGTSIIAQTNKFPQQVLSILENVRR